MSLFKRLLDRSQNGSAEKVAASLFEFCSASSLADFIELELRKQGIDSENSIPLRGRVTAFVFLIVDLLLFQSGHVDADRIRAELDSRAKSYFRGKDWDFLLLSQSQAFGLHIQGRAQFGAMADNLPYVIGRFFGDEVLSVRNMETVLFGGQILVMMIEATGKAIRGETP